MVWKLYFFSHRGNRTQIFFWIMTNSVYEINKGINKVIEFKGLKAQYIWWLGGGIIALMILFAIMYMAGINSFICVGFILAAGTFVFMYVYKLSNKYGE